MRNTISDMNAYYNTQINTSVMSPSMQPNQALGLNDHARTQTQPDQKNENSRNVENDDKSISLMTP